MTAVLDEPVIEEEEVSRRTIQLPHDWNYRDSPAAPDWTDAACAGYENPDLFFPSVVQGGRVDPYQTYWMTENYCSRCPIKDACLQYAKDSKFDSGIWGGVLFTMQRRRAGEFSIPTYTPTFEE